MKSRACHACDFPVIKCKFGCVSNLKKKKLHYVSLMKLHMKQAIAYENIPGNISCRVVRAINLLLCNVRTM